MSDDGLEAAVASGDAAAALAWTEAGGWVLTIGSPTDVPDLGAAVRTYQIGRNAAEAGVDPVSILAGSDLTVAFAGGDGSGRWPSPWRRSRSPCCSCCRPSPTACRSPSPWSPRRSPGSSRSWRRRCPSARC
ncbi:hypothetical protein G7085_03280 [Tessaracoccus sp. HDW20]|uniref:hypothetical protein n=1 Tax=Tessaracoccus coleopterorum TaxID=2714950 RepID=UPI0018D346A3|nr:hypothetical protein [Tessaracoccus coleopterorum]NHB84014.1 hypothetical protein [Tessaracoccus coleopterorum]